MYKITLVFKDETTLTYEAESFNTNDLFANNPELKDIVVSEVES